MAKKKKYKGYPTGGYVRLYWKVLSHPAYIKLPPTAKGMLPYFLRKVYIGPLDPKYTYQEIQFTYSEAKKYGCARRSFYRVINDLMAHGFIDPVHRGVRTASIFRLSRRWEDYGTSAFKEIVWRKFGQDQIRRLVEKWHPSVAKSEPDKSEERKRVCQK